MKPKKGKGKKRSNEWRADYDSAFSHDLARHRKALHAVPSNIPSLMIPPEDVKPNAVVIAHVGQWAFAFLDGKEQLCFIDTALDRGRSSLLVPGDEVLVEEYEGQPVVRGAAPRRTRLSRLAHIHSRLEEQVIAANVDVLAIVTTIVKPRFKMGVVDRLLIGAEIGGVSPILVVNKMDLADDEPEQIQSYRDLGLTVINTSCETGLGIDSLRAALEGKTSVFAGQSGVGKSSLLNAMHPCLELDTQQVSDATEKGKHTTTGSRLYLLDEGTRVIDTAGVRQLGVWGVTPDELAFYFPEMAEISLQCKFRNCTHTHEPACAIQEAAETGTIPKLRYESYKRIRASLEE